MYFLVIYLVLLFIWVMLTSANSYSSPASTATSYNLVFYMIGPLDSCHVFTTISCGGAVFSTLSKLGYRGLCLFSMITQLSKKNMFLLLCPQPALLQLSSSSPLWIQTSIWLSMSFQAIAQYLKSAYTSTSMMEHHPALWKEKIL